MIVNDQYPPEKHWIKASSESFPVGTICGVLGKEIMLKVTKPVAVGDIAIFGYVVRGDELTPSVCFDSPQRIE